MAANINKVLIAGNLTKDPQIKFFANEKAKADFGIAINERWKDKDGNQQQKAVFIDCEAWGRTAELVGQYLTKGSSCFIEGRLQLDQWEDKEGQKRSKLKVVADNVQFLDSGNRDGGGERTSSPAPAPAQERKSAPAAKPEVDQEPPF